MPRNLCRLAIACATLLVVTDVLPGQTPIRAVARITYLAGGLAYLDAGRDDGLREGQQLTVTRNGESIAALTVTYLASHRAACTIGLGGGTLVVGDSVEFIRSAPTVMADSARQRASASRTRREGRLHGRIGVRYLRLEPESGGGFNQPALDIRLDGARLGSSAIGLVLDLRARRTYRQVNDSTRSVEARNALYQAAILVRPAGPARLTLGRQFLPTVSSVSLFDGALVELQGRRVGAGAFAGAEPDPATMGVGINRDLGFFLEARGAPGRPVRWQLAGGAIGSYARGEVNREFGFLQASVVTPGLTLLAAQEIDLNRSWKAEAGEPGITFTSTYASLTARPTEWLSLQTGVDNRRSVRLYRDLETPEATFDDSFRQGLWGGVSFDAAGRFRFGMDGRAGFGADSLARTRSGTLWLGLDRISVLRLGVRSRHTRYSSIRRAGWLHSGGITARPRSWLGLEAIGGARRETGDSVTTTATWLGANVDVSLGRTLYLFGSWSRETGNLAVGRQFLASLSWRF
jgi:hypothetical protein